MPLGEVPITSYFQAKSLSQKRRIATHSARPTKKKKGEDSNAVAGPSTSPKRIDEHFQASLPSSSKNAKATILTSCRDTDGRGPRKQLEVSPLSNETPCYLRREAQLGLDNVTSGGPVINTTYSRCSGTAAVAGRPNNAAEHVRNIHPANGIAPKSQAQIGRDALVNDSRQVEEVIPSSQSQSEMTWNPANDAVLMHPPRDINKSMHSKANMYTSVRHASSALQGSDTDVEDLNSVIPSSQSQPPLTIHDTPKKPFRPAAKPLQKPTANECIPSSQSQEIDLVIPSDEEEKPLPNLAATPYPVKHSPTKPKGDLARTLSDELFPVPIQHSLFADIFEDIGKSSSQQEASPNAIDKQPEEEFSVTESESETECVAKPVMERREDHKDLPPSSSSVASPHVEQESQEDGDDEYEPNSSGVHSVESTLGGTLTVISQPLAVKEFEEMFGSGDESYPPDFPMSLRS
ncbi:hypothetical protein CPC08DRAFT_181198 [Agrocybe pediades]|nr:hypothetical protein CPC08DRAFT_181198 [Agrocybe pediades]